jgi:hypothetical protein
MLNQPERTFSQLNRWLLHCRCCCCCCCFCELQTTSVGFFRDYAGPPIGKGSEPITAHSSKAVQWCVRKGPLLCIGWWWLLLLFCNRGFERRDSFGKRFDNDIGRPILASVVADHKLCFSSLMCRDLELVQFGIFLHITAAATTTFTVQVRFCTLQWDLFRLLTTSSQKIDRIRMREKKSTLVTRVHVSHPRVRDSHLLRHAL